MSYGCVVVMCVLKTVGSFSLQWLKDKVSYTIQLMY